MPRTREEILALLNGENAPENLSMLLESEPLPETGSGVNNHIHTTYSFSPYSPAAAVWFARAAGLCTCGLMDHDSIAGAREFISAARTARIGATIGVECRVSFAGTPFSARTLDNPDQKGIGYVALHGIPHNRISEVDAFFAPRRVLRAERSRRMTEAVSSLMGGYGIRLDFDRDVLPLSNYAKGGAVTERHISCALARRLLETVGSGDRLVSFIRQNLRLPISARVESYLRDPDNPYLMYDLLGWIKSQLVSGFYIDALDECPDVHETLAMAERVGAIAAYAYLGDVGDSVTGDKRAQKFEDDYLDELIEYIAGIGFRALTYMPSRNTRAQLDRVRALCGRFGLFQISGEDINSPRQPFVSEAQRDPAFRNLYDAAWALIAHERRAAADPKDGFFSPESMARWPDLNERTLAFSKFGREIPL